MNETSGRRISSTSPLWTAGKRICNYSADLTRNTGQMLGIPVIQNMCDASARGRKNPRVGFLVSNGRKSLTLAKRNLRPLYPFSSTFRIACFQSLRSTNGKLKNWNKSSTRTAISESAALSQSSFFLCLLRHQGDFPGQFHSSRFRRSHIFAVIAA